MVKNNIGICGFFGTSFGGLKVDYFVEVQCVGKNDIGISLALGLYMDALQVSMFGLSRNCINAVWTYKCITIKVHYRL